MTMKNLITLFIIISFLFSGVAVNATSHLTTYYQLDTGIVFIWSNSAGIWQQIKRDGRLCEI